MMPPCGLGFDPGWRTSLAEKEQHSVALLYVELKVVDALEIIHAATTGMKADDQSDASAKRPQFESQLECSKNTWML